MKNDEQNEDPPVETIEGRLKRLRTNEVDSRKRLKLQEEEGGRAGKTKATWKGESTNSLKRKHRQKECKGFARVGWILDYGLRLREEKKVCGWEKENN